MMIRLHLIVFLCTRYAVILFENRRFRFAFTIITRLLGSTYVMMLQHELQNSWLFQMQYTFLVMKSFTCLKMNLKRRFTLQPRVILSTR